MLGCYGSDASFLRQVNGVVTPCMAKGFFEMVKLDLLSGDRYDKQNGHHWAGYHGPPDVGERFAASRF